jgi:DNA-binding NarL/FixJ family response regulator
MHGADDPLVDLTAREREVLALVAAGRSDLGISETLFVTRKTVEFHTRNIFRKLRIPASERDNRRVHAALTFLQHEG